jgi:hypothetical protein
MGTNWLTHGSLSLYEQTQGHGWALSKKKKQKKKLGDIIMRLYVYFMVNCLTYFSEMSRERLQTTLLRVQGIHLPEIRKLFLANIGNEAVKSSSSVRTWIIGRIWE